MTFVPLIYRTTLPERLPVLMIQEEELDHLEAVARKAFQRAQESARNPLLAVRLVTEEELTDRIDQVRQRVLHMRASYSEDPREGVQEAAATLPKEEVKRLADASESFKKVKGYFGRELADTGLIAVGHLLEVADQLMSEGYYVFTHGQTLNIAVYSDLFTGVWFERYAPADFPNRFYRMWRMPGTTHPVTTLKELKGSSLSGVSDNAATHSFLSVDARLTRRGSCESALYFFAHSTNIATRDGGARFHRERRAEFLRLMDLESEPMEEALGSLVGELSRWIIGKQKPGRISLIAVPKARLQQELNCFVYRSHPFGAPCTCIGKKHNSFIRELERDQAMKGVECQSSSPQYRMLVHGLEADLSVRTIPFDSMTHVDQAEYQRRVDQILSLLSLAKGLEGLLPSSVEKTVPELFDSTTVSHLLALPNDHPVRREMEWLIRDKKGLLRGLPKEVKASLSEEVRSLLPLKRTKKKPRSRRAASADSAAKFKTK